MGLSGFIMKKKNAEKTVGQVLWDLRTAAERAGLEYKEHRDGVYKEFDGRLCATCWIANYFMYEDVYGKRVLLIELYSAEGQYYDITNGEEFYTAAVFDRIGDREEILLELLYEYFKMNPEDYFQSNEQYTSEDIAELYKREFDPNWLCKDSKIKENLNKVEEGKHTRPAAGHIIKQSKEKTIYEIIHDVKTAAKKAHLNAKMDSELYQNDNGVMFGVAHITEEGVQGDELLLYIPFEAGWGDFEWIEENRKLLRAIVFHKICGREIMLLDFLDEYFKLNPNDYFVDAYTLHEGNKWYYTPEDIKKIREKDFDDTWCYKKPLIEERLERKTAGIDRMAGISAFLLKRDGCQTVHKIMHDVKTAAEKAGLNFWIESSHNVYWKKSSDAYAVCHLEGNGDKMWNGIKQQMQVEIRSTGQDIHRYDWIQDGGRLIQAIAFSNISDNEGILLVFLQEYFKICPEVYLVVGNTAISEDAKWYFSRKEIERAVQHGGMWCYKNPHIKLRTWLFNYTEPVFFD